MSDIQLPKPARQGPWPGDPAMYSEAQMRAMYQHGYAAALSQPAGVADATKSVCDGCQHLKTEWWRDHLDNDETDSGTSATCTKDGRNITAYWREGSARPNWCPLLAAAPAASAKYCSDERPCIPCFSNNGPCEDAPAASGGECNCASGRGAEHCVVHAHAAWDAPKPPSGASQSSNPNPVTPGLSSESGASVSERAVEMLAQEVEKDMTACADDIRAGKLHGMAAASIRAIEHALSSPRQEGEVLARGWFHALPEFDDYEFHDDASGAGKNCSGCISAMIVNEGNTAASTQGDDNE